MGQFLSDKERSMKQRLRLLVAIREAGFRQIDFAKAVGDHETVVSRVVNGWLNLPEERKKKYAEVLCKSVEELFSDAES
jgi:hypothetical protein